MNAIFVTYTCNGTSPTNVGSDRIDLRLTPKFGSLIHSFYNVNIFKQRYP